MSVLSSLLARDQVVPVKKIEEAIQRQVISGGELPTVLLEVGAASENVIASYHAASVELLPASRDELMSVSADVSRLVSKALAEKHRVVPVAVDANAITVACAFVPSDAVLNELAEATGRRVLVRIATEPRVAAALQKHHGIAPATRMRRLLQKLEAQAPGEIVPVTSLLENRVDRTSLAPRGPGVEAGPSVRPSAVGSWARGGKAESAGAEATTAASGNSRGPQASAASVAPAAGTNQRGAVAVGVSRVVGVGSASPASSGRENAASSYAHGRQAVPRASREARAADEAPVNPAPSAAERVEPVTPTPVPPPRLPDTLDADAAVAALAAADSRDAIFAAAFAHVRTHFDYCAMFTVHDDELEGVDAAGDGATADEVRALALELDRPGSLRDVKQLVGPKAGVLDGTEADRDLAARLGRTTKQPSVLLPIAIRQRLVMVVYGDRGGRSLGVGDVAELLAFLPRVSEALQRLILKRKRGSDGKVARIEGSGSSQPAPAKDWARAAVAAASQPEAATSASEAAADEPPQPVQVEVAPAEPASASEPEGAGGDAVGTSERPRAFALLGVPRKAPEPPELGAARAAPAARSETQSSRSSTRPSWVPGKPVGETTYRGGGGEEEVVLTRRKSGRAKGRSSRPPSTSEAAPQVASEALAPARVPAELQQIASPSPDAPPAAASPSTAAARNDDDEPEISVSEPAEPTIPDATIITDLGLDLDEIVDALISCDRDKFDVRVNELLQFGEPALRVLVRRFPGPLWIEARPGASGPHPRGRDAGPVLRAILAFRGHATPHVATLLDSRDVGIRYFAVLLAAEMPHRDLVGRIGRRVLDDDAAVRAVAVSALRACRRFDEEVAEVLAHFRRVAGNDRAPATLRQTAIELLGELRDGDAVNVLVDVLAEAEPTLSRVARDALVRITKQDFGTAAQGWEPWLAKNAELHRIEWLIDALLHDDDVLRKEAGEELKTLTQEYFGFQSALPRKEREVVQRKYRKWWETHGRARFVKH